jgi:hypothetical protein
MRNILMVIAGMPLFCNFGFSQEALSQTERYTNPVKIPTMKQRYKLDYELVNSSLLGSDSLLLLKIESDFIERARKETEDTIVHLPDDGIAIRVYSYERVAINKRK